MIRRPPRSTLFPYTTLFRSQKEMILRAEDGRVSPEAGVVLLAVGDERPLGPDRGRSTTPASDRKSTRLNSSHGYISYAVFCLKKKRLGEACLHCSHTPSRFM